MVRPSRDHKIADSPIGSPDHSIGVDWAPTCATQPRCTQSATQSQSDERLDTEGVADGDESTHGAYDQDCDYSRGR